MASKTPKKTLVKKKAQTVTKKKTGASPSKKVAVIPKGKVKKTVTAKKGEKKVTPAKKGTAAKKAMAKPVAKKTAAIKPAKKPVKAKKPQGKTEAPRDRLFDLRKSLISKKEHILKEAKEEILKYISGENKQLVDTALDDGDWAQVDISEDINLQRLAAHRKLLHNIDEAIRKIGDGTYGICEECGEEISEKRLMVLPTATLCVDCQENREQFEALETEE